MKKIDVPENVLQGLAGTRDANLKLIESQFQVEIAARGHEIAITGDPSSEAMVADCIGQLADLIGHGYTVSDSDLAFAARMMLQDGNVKLAKLLPGQVRPSQKKSVSPRSPNQHRYIESIRENDMV